MGSESDFRRCVDSLIEVGETYRRACVGLTTPTKYEADSASFRLMEAVLQHVEGSANIAMLPKPGSHLVSAWVLLRSAFEVALTAYWLTIDDDWKEREARWLGWIAGEEEHQRKLAGDLRPITDDGARLFEDYATRLEQRRIAITQLLPKDSRAKRPSIPRILQECAIDPRYYISYRIGSQLTHGGPTVNEEIWKFDGSDFRTKEIGYSAWVGPLRMAGWCIAQPSWSVLCRAGATQEAAESVVDAQERLQSAVASLER